MKAPSGYEADSEFHLIDTETSLELITRVEVENEKTNVPEKPIKPEKPEKPDKPEEPDKPDTPTEVPRTGDNMPLYPLLLFLILSLFGLISCKSAQKKF